MKSYVINKRIKVRLIGEREFISNSIDGISSPKNIEILQNLTNKNNFIRPYFKIYTNLDDISLWCPNASDVLADDWQIV